MTALAIYERARAALAEATRVDQVLSIRDEMAHAKLYAQQIKDRALMAEAAEIQLRVERRLGVLLDAAKQAGELAGRGRQPKCSDPEHLPPVTLAEIGVDRKLAAVAQKTASISEQAFEAMVAAKREQIVAGRPINLNPGEVINGARAIMGSRVEPDDSLDYFPTPPWATRALLVDVFTHLGRNDRKLTAWEPACGEGHIAEVLREYFADVVASDIHDYGYDGSHVADYLDAVPGADWIITNPPFEERAEAFTLKALDDADVGVAMFVRLQWLETVGRYERIFRDRPPTLIAFFSERVNLCKGRWDPEGGTATAYIWLVWLKGQAPRAPFWIPPGRREAHTRSDDVERFTARPVMRKQHPVDATGAPVGHDNETGEVVDQPALMTAPESANAHGCTASFAAPAAAPVAAGASPAVAGEDPLDIPAFLRRRPAEEIAATAPTGDAS